MYVNPTIRSDTHVAFSLCFPSIFWKSILIVLCFILSKICSLFFSSTLTMSGIFSQNIKIMSGTSGICELRLEWQPGSAFQAPKTQHEGEFTVWGNSLKKETNGLKLTHVRLG